MMTKQHMNHQVEQTIQAPADTFNNQKTDLVI
mgnify:CR=1 FL=1